MKTLLLFLAVVFCGATSNAQNLKINFKGSGASTTISTVQIQNLTRGTTLTIRGEDTLQLTSVTGIEPVKNENASALTIYPNPTFENSFLEFMPPEPGNAIIRICDFTGRQMAVYENFLVNAKQKFVLSCVGNGSYVVSVSGRNYHFSGQLISLGNYSGTSSIIKANELSISPEKIPATVARSVYDDTTTMAYSPGEMLYIKASSGKFSTVLVDSPGEDKTIEFDFVDCTDGDNNNYPVVKIGDQVWMAENLKTTKYRDGEPIPYKTGPDTSGLVCDGPPGYSWYNDDSTYKNIYGGLYTLTTLKTKRLCPAGWHVMDHYELDTLIEYLGGKSVAGGKMKETGTAHWKSPNEGATNESGFTALAGGMRHENATFMWMGERATFMSFNTCDGTGGCMYELNFRNGEIEGDEWPGTFSTSVRCVYGGGPQIISTWIDTLSVDLTSATAGGDIDKMETVTERGLCWSTHYYPTIADNYITAGSGTGRFSGRITGLDPGHLYFVRAYGRNETGITYADPVEFTTSVKDIDGNIYKTVLLDIYSFNEQGGFVYRWGEGIWLNSNLRTSRLNDNTLIPELSSGTDWGNTDKPAFCSYDNRQDEESGLLYNWFAVETGKLCPAGWEVADTIEYRINDGFGRHQVKPLPASGMRDLNGEFKEKGVTGYYWFSISDVDNAKAWYWSYNPDNPVFQKEAKSKNDKNSGFSVRCFIKVHPH